MKNCICPEFPIFIKNIKVYALLDTGAEISCISGDFYNDNLKIFRDAPRLPVTGKVAKGAFGDKNNRVKVQIMISVTFESRKNDLIFFVIPKLIRDCILGHDSLEVLKVLIDPEEKQIIFKDNNQKVAYKIANFEQKTCEERRISLVDNFQCAVINEFSIAEITEYDYSNNSKCNIDEIPLEEIKSKIFGYVDLDFEQKHNICELINAYKEAISKIPGRIDTHEHSFKLKSEKPVMIKQ